MKFLRSRSPSYRSRSRRSSRDRDEDSAPMSQEERDARTVLCTNLSNKAHEDDVVEFFRDCGRIRSIRVIKDQFTGRSKGVAYVEFYRLDAINKAVELTGTKLLGHSLVVENSGAEKNREYAAQKEIVKSVQTVGGRKIKVQNVHKDIDANMLRAVFKVYGSILECIVTRDDSVKNDTLIGYIMFSTAAIAKKVVGEMNEFQLAGFKLILTQLPEAASHLNRSTLDSEIIDRGGVKMGRVGRYQLMQKLAEGTGLVIPQTTPQISDPYLTSVSKPQLRNLATQCIVVSNFFDGKK